MSLPVIIGLVIAVIALFQIYISSVIILFKALFNRKLRVVLNAKRYEVVIVFLWELSIPVVIALLLLWKDGTISFSYHFIPLVALFVVDFVILSIIKLEEEIRDYTIGRRRNLIYMFIFKNRFYDFIFRPRAIVYGAGLFSVVFGLADKYLLK